MYDVVIIGGGIVGLSTGRLLAEQAPHAKIAVIEKEDGPARHQTGRNSGVIHSGIYYTPGSLKAKLARQGNAAMVRFCETHDIPYDVCGKVIVATEREEVPLLERLYERGQQNEIAVSMLGSEELREIEPHVKGIQAIRVPSCGIVDYKAVSTALARIIREQGGDLLYGTKVEKIAEGKDGVTLETNKGSFQSRFVINCAGLYSDKVAQGSGVRTGMKIVPFRGEYYELVPEKRHLVKNLIYPVPNPDFPFLGVHFTRMMDGSIHAGPNAVLSFKREGYRKTSFNIREFSEVMVYTGFWKLAIANMGEGLKEMWRSLSKKAFLKSLQRMIPELTLEDIRPADAGVRAQALKPNGDLVDDFAIFHGEHSLHVCNAPSPAATASILIGQTIVESIPDAVLASRVSMNVSNGTVSSAKIPATNP
ncbi:L-2-hydroxyglutarate oxidase [Numidum massiliense]|uniref:L-2-hydroxyglutarate oxidase n=1 Tax=Numidum massiliense TaxID=1522315 RepID=UPI0006D52E81|nr:L-2-hydroxyglutarate oxidase [Numidum massiliense]